jgi:hypothetical protein
VVETWAPFRLLLSCRSSRSGAISKREQTKAMVSCSMFLADVFSAVTSKS